MPKLEVFVWIDPDQTQREEYVFPAKAMTSNSSQGCTASASSVYSTSYPAWRAFDLSETSKCWASSNSVTGPYLEFTFPIPLYDITVTVINRGDHASVINGPIKGDIYGWNKQAGETYLPPPEEGEYDETKKYNAHLIYSDRDGSTKQLSTSYYIEDTKDHCCDTIRFQIDTWKKTGDSKYTAIGEMKITGYSLPSSGSWVSTNSLI